MLKTDGTFLVYTVPIFHGDHGDPIQEPYQIYQPKSLAGAAT
jgi:hypothetical protein